MGRHQRRRNLARHGYLAGAGVADKNVIVAIRAPDVPTQSQIRSFARIARVTHQNPDPSVGVVQRERGVGIDYQRLEPVVAGLERQVRSRVQRDVASTETDLVVCVPGGALARIQRNVLGLSDRRAEFELIFIRDQAHCGVGLRLASGSACLQIQRAPGDDAFTLGVVTQRHVAHAHDVGDMCMYAHLHGRGAGDH